MILGPEIITLSISAAVAVWLVTHSRRRLHDPNKTLARLHPGELNNLDAFMTRDGDFLASDAEFWRMSGKVSGLIRKRNNAICLVRLCQMLCDGQNMNPETIAYLTRRSLLITFLVGCSVIEAVFRLFMRDLPHLCARNATQLYWDMENLAKVLFREYYEVNPLIADKFNTLLYTSTGTANAQS